MPTKKMYKKKRSSAPRRKMYRRRPASLGNLRVFTETLQVSDLACSSNLGSSGPGQSWGLSMASIPQIAQYKALYNEFKILKIRYQFIPWFNSDEKIQFYQNIGAGGTVETVPMLAYCVQRDAGLWPPLLSFKFFSRMAAELFLSRLSPCLSRLQASARNRCVLYHWRWFS